MVPMTGSTLAAAAVGSGAARPGEGLAGRRWVAADGGKGREGMDSATVGGRGWRGKGSAARRRGGHGWAGEGSAARRMGGHGRGARDRRDDGWAATDGGRGIGGTTDGRPRMGGHGQAGRGGRRSGTAS